ncbi:cell division suppressor protein YneA [Acetivibrio clariflavus]|uniref:LysM domain-containing protein n=1 Tax=Acetivibrio clariflavus (strain DSM 19732 / NBRC 101661 / EBR45) TaxID=720554 RepID=G8LTB0_ACECE|nr:LysM peptidoglycan-binding domain-containing protein [Acetivibrio clariflavus]AEV68357.1 LysM domain-containing protein [Acetivibrio clariflavus DSM 19732]
MKKRYVLKNKTRFYIFIVTLLLITFTVFSFTKAYGYKEPRLIVITIRSGDTLWSIAEKYNKKGDIREYIYKLKEINHLENSNIIAGNTLKVIVEE